MLNIFLGGRHPQVRTHPSTGAVLLLLLAANQIRILPWLAGRRSQKTVANIDSLVLEVGGSCAPSPTFFKPSRGSGSNLVAWKKTPKKHSENYESDAPGPLMVWPLLHTVLVQGIPEDGRCSGEVLKAGMRGQEKGARGKMSWEERIGWFGRYLEISNNQYSCSGGRLSEKSILAYKFNGLYL